MKLSNFPIITLALYGDELNPDEVSSILKVCSSRSQIKGSKDISPSGKVRVALSGAWILSSRDACSSSSISEHFKQLFALLINIKHINNIPGVQEALMIVAVSTSDQPHVVAIDRDSVRQCAELGVEIRIEAYPD